MDWLGLARPNMWIRRKRPSMQMKDKRIVFAYQQFHFKPHETYNFFKKSSFEWIAICLPLSLSQFHQFYIRLVWDCALEAGRSLLIVSRHYLPIGTNLYKRQGGRARVHWRRLRANTPSCWTMSSVVARSMTLYLIHFLRTFYRVRSRKHVIPMYRMQWLLFACVFISIVNMYISLGPHPSFPQSNN